MALITDPDQLNQGTEVTINTSALTITLNLAGNLSADGVTGQCLYSFLKEEWRTDSTLPKFPFPMESITPEQYEFIRGWLPANDATRKLIRTAGWAEKNAAGATLREYAGIVSLGTLGGTDQGYFQQGSSLARTNFTYQGAINEAIQIFGDATNGNFDRRTFLKLFAREQGKTYSQSQLSNIGVSALTYITYRFPLSNGADLKISASDATIAANTPYTSITVTYLPGQLFTAWSNATNYVLHDVVTRLGRWYRCIQAHSNQQPPNATYWETYAGERQIGSTYAPFNKIIAGANATAEQIYEKIQYLLRQATDIDSGPGTVTGNTADGDSTV